MPTFKAGEREWVIRLDAPTIREVRSECDGLNLADLEGKAIDRIAADPVLLVDTLWVLCREQAKAWNFTDVQFGRALVGEAIEKATEALVQAIADFFPRARAELMLATAAKSAKIRDLGMSRALAKINDPELEAQIVAAMEAQMDASIRQSLTRLHSAMNLPDSSVSPPEA